MSRILKPEDEVTVTPGKKAVEDLEELSGEVGHITLHNVRVPSPETASEFAEEYDSLLVTRGELTHSGPDPEFFDYSHAFDQVAKRSEFIPSAPLFLRVLHELHQSVEPAHSRVLKSIQESLRGGVSTNTNIYWEEGQIFHYGFSNMANLAGSPTPPTVKYIQSPPQNDLMECGYNLAMNNNAVQQFLLFTVGYWEREYLCTLLRVQDITVDLRYRDDMTSICFMATKQGRGIIDIGFDMDDKSHVRTVKYP